jgi:hypothetical protein
MRKTWTIAPILLTLLLSACAPEVGTREWCEDMDDTPKGDWSTNDAKAYARYCVLNTYKDEED